MPMDKRSKDTPGKLSSLRKATCNSFKLLKQARTASSSVEFTAMVISPFTRKRGHSSLICCKNSATTAGAMPYLLGSVEVFRSEEHTSELQSRFDLVCRLLLEK